MSRFAWRPIAHVPAAVNCARRLARRPSLLVLSIALTVAAGASDAVFRGTAWVESGVGRGPAPAASSAAPSAGGLAALSLSVGDRGADRASPPVAGLSRIALASTDLPTGCPGNGSVDTGPTLQGHRDDVAARPADRSADGCLLAGPKRFHGAAGRGDVANVVAATGPAAVATTAIAQWSGSFNLYRRTAFVTQKDFKWCVAASVQMMVNLVQHKDDRTAATQQRMISYAQASDHGPWGPGGGTDVTGWIAALRHFGAGKYRAVGARTPAAALRIAATAMRQTGRPAGLLVMEGRHAWILHGFESWTDPKADRRAAITSVRVSGPLYPIQQKHGYDPRPNTELSVQALAEFFQPSSVGALVGRYVVIVPVH